VQRDRDYAMVSVRDDGIGIEPDMLTRVFEMFTPAHRSIDDGQRGLRIGLSLVRTIVDMHGGSVEARSMLIALTGWGQGEDRTGSRVNGSDHHLNKPVDISVLQLY
jgi:signal transduction histidine kinase